MALQDLLNHSTHTFLAMAPTAADASSTASRKRDLHHVGLDGRFSMEELLHHSDETDTQQSPLKRAKVDEEAMSTPPGSPVSVDASASPKSGTPKASRPNMSASHSITLEMLRPHFEEPLAQVAKQFGICVTLLKKICRKHGISRWPHRQITGLRKSIASMEHAIGYFEGARRDSYAHQLHKQKTKLALLLEDPTKCNPPSSSSMSNEDEDQSSSTSSTPQGSPAPQYQSPMAKAFVPSASFVSCEFIVSPRLPSVQQQQHFVGAAAPIYLPPLRLENRRMLPPIASLVSHNSSAHW
ncbi:Rwp-rk domain, partial [Globisporangium splendens]